MNSDQCGCMLHVWTFVTIKSINCSILWAWDWLQSNMEGHFTNILGSNSSVRIYTHEPHNHIASYHINLHTYLWSLLTGATLIRISSHRPQIALEWPSYFLPCTNNHKPNPLQLTDSIYSAVVSSTCSQWNVMRIKHIKNVGCRLTSATLTSEFVVYRSWSHLLAKLSYFLVNKVTIQSFQSFSTVQAHV